MMGFWKTCIPIFTFIMLSNILIISTTTLLHEMGHFFVGILYGCEVKMVLFDIQTMSTYTELVCENAVKMLISLGSFIFTIPFALFFMLLRGFIERRFSVIIIGLSIFSGSLDISEAFGLPFLFYISYFIGTIIMCYGEIALINDVISRAKYKNLI